MKYTKGHAPIADIVTASGYNDSRRESYKSIHDEEAWMARRRASLARLKRKRQSRRAGPNSSGWTEELDSFDEVKGRFPIVEEDIEEDAVV